MLGSTNTPRLRSSEIRSRAWLNGAGLLFETFTAPFDQPVGEVRCREQPDLTKRVADALREPPVQRDAKGAQHLAPS